MDLMGNGFMHRRVSAFIVINAGHTSSV